MPKPSMPRLWVLGVVVLLLGVNISAGVFLFTLAGGTGSFTLLELLFWGGQVLNFVGFGIVLYAVLSRWAQRTKKGG